jgi:hypothetical protein
VQDIEELRATYRRTGILYNEKYENSFIVLANLMFNDSVILPKMYWLGTGAIYCFDVLCYQ